MPNEPCCAFCTDETKDGRLLGYNQVAQNIIEEVEKAGRNKVKAQFPGLLKAVDALNIAGDSYGQTFVERFKLADAVCKKMLQNESPAAEISQYAKHLRDNKHSSF